MKSISDISYSTRGHERQKLDIYLPEAESFPTLVFFHGGGIENGDKSSLKWLGEKLAENGICAVCPNYRMYPDAVYPEFIRDAASAVAWVKKNINTYGSSTSIYVGGSSAGAYLSMMLAFDKKYLAVHRMSPTDIAGFFHDAGQPTAHFNVLREKGMDSRRVIIDETAPIYYIGIDEKLPPMLFTVSTNDINNRLEQTHLVMSTLKSFGFEGEDWEERVLEGTHTHYTHTSQAEIAIEYITKREKLKNS